MRLVFLGTPDAAVPPLQALVEAGHDVLAVVSRADKRRGRGAGLSPSPVKAAALELGLPVTSKVDDVIGAGADLGVVVAFGQIIKPHILAVLPMVNLHFSLLPRWRGAAPVERAILAGDVETGVCVMEVEEGLDTGGVYATARTPIGPDETAQQLRSRLVVEGTRLLIDTLGRPGGLGPPQPQDGEPTYAAKVTVEDLRLDWDRPAVQLARLPRVGKSWTTFRGKRLLVLAARAVSGGAVSGGAVSGVGRGPVPGPALAPGEFAPTGAVVGTSDGVLDLLEVQPEGKGPMPAAAWRNGARPMPGERLGC